MGLKRLLSGTGLAAIVATAAILASLAASGCGASKKPIIVGSKDTVEQSVLGEIIAQHLEHRLGRKVTRRPNLGYTPAAYQAIINGEIGIYPEETGTLQANILRESPSYDAATTYERVRSEMLRIAQLRVFPPLGVDDSWAVVVPKSLAQNIDTLTDAQNYKDGWKIGVTHDFNDRKDGLAAFNQYRMPLAAAPRSADQAALYASLASGALTMVVGIKTDGWLERHPEWKVLEDDQKVFGYYQTCVMARSELLNSDPKIEIALAELSGKFSNEVMQKLNAEVAVDHKPAASVAKQFLQANLQ